MSLLLLGSCTQRIRKQIISKIFCSFRRSRTRDTAPDAERRSIRGDAKKSAYDQRSNWSQRHLWTIVHRGLSTTWHLSVVFSFSHSSAIICRVLFLSTYFTRAPDVLFHVDRRTCRHWSLVCWGGRRVVEHAFSHVSLRTVFYQRGLWTVRCGQATTVPHDTAQLRRHIILYNSFVYVMVWCYHHPRYLYNVSIDTIIKVYITCCTISLLLLLVCDNIQIFQLFSHFKFYFGTYYLFCLILILYFY